MMKHRIGKIKRIMITTIAAVCALSSTAAICANATSSSKSVKLTNGYEQKLSFNVSKSSGTSTFSISNGGPLEISNYMCCIEYDSGGHYFRSLANSTGTSYTTSQTSTLKRSSSSNYLSYFYSLGYNNVYTAKENVNGGTYFVNILIGDKDIETKYIFP